MFCGVGRYDAKVCSTFLMDEGGAMKTTTDRAVEAIEAAEIMFAHEMGAVLNLSPAAKVALISKDRRCDPGRRHRRAREAPYAE